MFRPNFGQIDRLRQLCSVASRNPLSTLASNVGVLDQSSEGAKKLNLSVPLLQHKQTPVYELPYYGSTDTEISELSDDAVSAALRLYGGLMRKQDTATVLRARLLASTRADYRPKLLTMEGVVISDKMNKSVVVASRRRAYEPKLQMKYWRTRRFMAHDELDLCREGDRVLIRSCRPLSKRKSFVVVRNYGDPTNRSMEDDHARAEAIATAAEPDPTGKNSDNVQLPVGTESS